MNKELLRTILTNVENNPQYWEDAVSISSHKPCFKGIYGLLDIPLPICVLDDGTLAYEDKTILNTVALLGIAQYQALRLFNPFNTWAEPKHILELLIGTDSPAFDDAYYAYLIATYGVDYTSISCMRMCCPK
jgi:hypothetical protein